MQMEKPVTIYRRFAQSRNPNSRRHQFSDCQAIEAVTAEVTIKHVKSQL